MDDRSGVSTAGQGRPHPDSRGLTPGLAAKTQAYLFLTAGAVGALGVLLPHPEQFNELGMLSVQVSSIVCGFVLFALAHRTAPWVTRVGPYGAVLATSAVMVFSQLGRQSLPAVLPLGRLLRVLLPAHTRGPSPGGVRVLNFCLVLAALPHRPRDPDRRYDRGGPVRLRAADRHRGVAGAFIVLLRERVDAPDPPAHRRGEHRPADRTVQPPRATRAPSSASSHARNAASSPMSVLQADCDLFKSYNARSATMPATSALLPHRSDARGRPPAGRRGRADRRRGVRA